MRSLHLWDGVPARPNSPAGGWPKPVRSKGAQMSSVTSSDAIRASWLATLVRVCSAATAGTPQARAPQWAARVKGQRGER